MDIYIFTAYFLGSPKQEITVNANSRFTAYARAIEKALEINSNLHSVYLEKITFKF